MTWPQNYDPLGNPWCSTLVAALPVVVLLGSIAALKMRIHRAALLGLGTALAVATLVYHFPARLAAATTVYGAAYGLFPIGWIILNLIFLYQLTVAKGHFAVLRGSLARLAPDPRVQVILIAFSLGAFFEGCAGFGAPVAITAAILMQLGFRPLAASGLSLIANTAPVAFGSLGTPIIALSKTTGIDELTLSAMVGRQLPFFSLIIPFWVVCAMAGWRGMWEVWPAALTAGVAFAVPQFLVSNFHGPALVDITASVCSIASLALLLCFWRPARIWKLDMDAAAVATPAEHDSRAVLRAWTPWMLLTLFVFLWGLPAFKNRLNACSPHPNFKCPGLQQSDRARAARCAHAHAEASGQTRAGGVWFELADGDRHGNSSRSRRSWFGCMGFSPEELLNTWFQTWWRIRYSLTTIVAMLALGYLSRYSGTDATLGLALARTGRRMPFFGTLMGWLGVALTGSDTASNVLFGNLQTITTPGRWAFRPY